MRVFKFKFFRLIDWKLHIFLRISLEHCIRRILGRFFDVINNDVSNCSSLAKQQLFIRTSFNSPVLYAFPAQLRLKPYLRIFIQNNVLLAGF